MRSDAALSILTEEQRADLFDWLTTDTYDVVLKRIAHFSTLLPRFHDISTLFSVGGAPTHRDGFRLIA